MPEDKQKKESAKEEKIVEVTPKEKTRFIEDLVFKGEARYGKELLQGKLKVMFKSMTTNEQLELEEMMPKVEGSAAYVMHVYSVRLVATTLIYYNDKDLREWPFEKKEAFIKELPGAVQDAIIATHNEFQEKLQAVTQGTELDKSFFDIPSTS